MGNYFFQVAVVSDVKKTIKHYCCASQIKTDSPKMLYDYISENTIYLSDDEYFENISIIEYSKELLDAIKQMNKLIPIDNKKIIAIIYGSKSSLIELIIELNNQVNELILNSKSLQETKELVSKYTEYLNKLLESIKE